MAEKITAIVLSAGSGRRMHSSIPKQYLDLCGRPVIAWTIEAFQKCAQVTDIILVSGSEDTGYCSREIVQKYGFSKVKMVIPGGSERGESVLFGLRAADPDTDYVLIHDGARPLIDQNSLERVILEVKESKAAVLGIPAKDTIKVVDSGEIVVSTPDRSSLRMMQTPQAFSYSLILAAYEKVFLDHVSVTDDSMAAEYSGYKKIKIVEGSPANIKITTPEDMILAEALLKKQRNA